MKKLFLMAAMALISLGASAQHAVGGLTLQPQVGLSLATVTKTDDTSLKAGLMAGAELEYQVTDMLGLAAGVNYSMQGTARDHTDNLNLDYVNIPLRAKVYVAPGFSINGGIQLGFMASAKVDGKDWSDVYDKTFDLSLPIGASYEYQNIVFDARYNFGLTGVSGNKLMDDQKNSVLQFTVGYRFDL
ncbi:MAG: porin family protein [Prevotella sp.]|nr:porin family protein [Prevotella sp.]